MKYRVFFVIWLIFFWSPKKTKIVTWYCSNNEFIQCLLTRYIFSASTFLETHHSEPIHDSRTGLWLSFEGKRTELVDVFFGIGVHFPLIWPAKKNKNLRLHSLKRTACTWKHAETMLVLGSVAQQSQVALLWRCLVPSYLVIMDMQPWFFVIQFDDCANTFSNGLVADVTHLFVMFVV